MTRLLNLESYVECAHYAQLFNQAVAELKPKSLQEYSSSYKNFLQNHAKLPYQEVPAISSQRNQVLETNQSAIPEQKLGTILSEGDDLLFLLRDTIGSFTLSQEFQGGRYLYASAFHYWNNICLFRQKTFLQDQSIVFVDLDSFGSDRLIPISFRRPSNSEDLVPIIDTRKIIQLNLDQVELHQQIHQQIAQSILYDNFSLVNDHATRYLADYLQKVAFFQKIQDAIEQDNFSLLVEFPYKETILYREITWQLPKVEAIIIEALKTQITDLQAIANQYPVALTTQYSHFPNVRNFLESLNLVVLKPGIENFDSIWKLKQQENIPLYGFYLDKLEFQIRLNEKPTWLKIASDEEEEISYEGQTKVITAKVPETNKTSFTISKDRKTSVDLPIKVNDGDYCINAIPQIYHIEIQDQDGSENIEISIEFCLKPDTPPKLWVRDLKGRCTLYPKLIDRPEPKTTALAYLPPEKIVSDRHARSVKQVEKLRENSYLKNLNSDLMRIKKVTVNNSFNLENILILKSSLKNIRDGLNDGKTGYLHFIDTSSKDLYVSQIKTDIKSANLDNLVQKIPQLLKIYSQLIQKPLTARDKSLKRELFSFIVLLLTVIGKTYQFSQFYSTSCLLDSLVESIKLAQIAKISDQYFHCLSRISLTVEKQKIYFNFFNSYYSTEGYIWGYGRILMWYFNFELFDLEIAYKNHFELITNCLLNPAKRSVREESYRQSAFLALIYLLTFRRIDSSFCKDGSSERNYAEQVIAYFKDQPSYLKQANTEKSLNDLFKELLEGEASESDIDKLISANT